MRIRDWSSDVCSSDLEFVSHTLTLEYNNLAAVQAAFAQHGADIACVIVEPVAGNMNLIKPAAGFLQGLRDVCTQHGAVLIFDEVMTGRSEEHTSELQSLMRISYAVFCLNKKNLAMT